MENKDSKAFVKILEDDFYHLCEVEVKYECLLKELYRCGIEVCVDSDGLPVLYYRFSNRGDKNE